MTEALQRMVEAMGAEFVRQVEGDDFASSTGRGCEWRLDGRFDLEKVARAGLAAVKDAPGDKAADAGWRMFPKYLGTAEESRSDAVDVFSSMVEEILAP